MKKPAFRLESFLNLCRHREEIEEMRLAQLQGEELTLEEILHRHHYKLRQAQDELAPKQQGLIDLSDVKLYHQYISNLRRKLGRLGKKMDSVHEQLEEQRSQLQEAARRRKVVSKLKDRVVQKHRRDFDRREQKEHDELHLLRLKKSSRSTE